MTLAPQAPSTALQASEAWATLSRDERRRRAAVASRDRDSEALCGLLEAHLLTFGKRGLAVSRYTLRNYRYAVTRWVTWCGTHGLVPHQAGRLEALRWVRSLQADGLKPQTVNQHVSAARALSAALRWCALTEADPFADVALRVTDRPEELRLPYSADELAALLGAAEGAERAFVLLAADGGLRIGEMAELRWADVDMPGDALTVVAGKGGKTARVVLTRRLLRELAVLRGMSPEAEWVLPWEVRTLQRMFGRLCERAGVSCRGVHALRHTAGTRLYEATGDLKVVQRHLRHSSVGTSAVYAHLADGSYRNAVQDALGA